MNKEEFVLYEEALALSEIGFDMPCSAYYHTNKELRFHSDGWLNEKCVASTYRQAFKWFREKHNLYYRIQRTVFPLDNNSEEFNYFIKANDEKELQDNLLDEYSTYEEAELACLKKLIEVVKQKSK